MQSHRPHRLNFSKRVNLGLAEVEASTDTLQNMSPAYRIWKTRELKKKQMSDAKYTSTNNSSPD